MKLFICNRVSDMIESDNVISDLFIHSENAIAILQETQHSIDWKKKVETKFQEVDFVLFLLGKKTFESDQIKWEYAKAKELNKQISGIKLADASNESVLFR